MGGRDGDVSNTVSTAGNASGQAQVHVGQACSSLGARMCAADAKRIPVLCEENVWKLQEPCNSNERCETTAGPDQGGCVAVATECGNREPNAQFCDGNMIRVCVDQKPISLRTCSAQQRCAQMADDIKCACAPGFGEHIAMWGDTIVIGAVGESTAAPGVNSKATGTATTSGAVYVFH